MTKDNKHKVAKAHLYQEVLKKYEQKDFISPLLALLLFSKDNIPPELTQVNGGLLREITGLRR